MKYPITHGENFSSAHLAVNAYPLACHTTFFLIWSTDSGGLGHLLRNRTQSEMTGERVVAQQRPSGAVLQEQSLP
ncbi:MAG: hypothetical protein OEV89_05205 [Desulfobulbaceae bacterium]|nr:hypothetical protein [Desulfobulbaceae bacterium]HIJ90147.1 hypothetical protein [Deltaproteobacteria bacterium]